MEIQESCVILSIALVTLLTCAWNVVNSLWLRPKKLEKLLKNQGFKGNPYKFLHGDVKDIISLSREAKSMRMDPLSDDIVPRVLPHHIHCVNLYGNNYCAWFGPTPRINISNPKLVREVLFNYEIFRKVTVTNPFIRLFVSGLVACESEDWATRRALLNPAFSQDKLMHMVSTMISSCCNLISSWDALVSTKGCCEIDVWPFLGNFTADVISRTAFGRSCDEGKRLFELQKEEISLAFQLMRSVYSYIPGSRFLPTTINRRLKKINDEMRTILKVIIHKKEEVVNEGGVSNDLLGILLKTISGGIQEQKNRTDRKMSTEEVIEECKLFYIVGQETTSVLLVWTMVLLSKNQEWQTLAREEAFAVFGDRKPDFDGLSQLKTITMILNEVLRLYPPGAMTARRVHKTAKLGEYVLPAGVEISLPFIELHHDHDIWGEDTKEFNPMRFSEGVSKAANVQRAFFPFSSGPRTCIGQKYSMMESKIALAMILRRFSFELSPSYVHAPTFLVTVQPQHGAHLTLTKI